MQRERGRFRSWLLAAIRHFLTNEWHRSHTQKRGGGSVVFVLDSVEAERRYHEEPSPDSSPDALCDRRWALTLIDAVLERLGEEFAAAGKAPLFAELRGALTGGARPYAEFGKTLGMSEGAVKIAVVRLRDRFRDLLRAEICVASMDESIESGYSTNGSSPACKRFHSSSRSSGVVRAAYSAMTCRCSASHTSAGTSRGLQSGMSVGKTSSRSLGVID